MKITFFKYLSLFLTGGMVYYFLEIFTRDYSHYSMIICGAVYDCLRRFESDVPENADSATDDFIVRDHNFV